ncbi:VWA domain-containing protein [Methylobacter sp. BlB1]|jgi:cobaltochelatase CobT|uniref:VWA domain-containing protein n=1 Tax=Methylobacter sp. BlB1 TaxID=2785914 RepID=UPI0018945203|nr:VWA domain-containing protein [Methylobacter sp. BlB1]MBF6650010.1 VWA domain-containing protein [Methylobacter sp. BlB1]
MRNNTLNSAFPIVAAALGNKFGVKVRVGGKDAYTDGKSITLPAYNLEDSSYKDVAWGYLAHEAAHLRFTDFADFGNAATSPVRKHILNILEDIRIEKQMQETYPGTRRTTEKVAEHLIKTGDFKVVNQDQEVHPATVLGQFLLFRLRNDVLGQNALSAYADTAEALLEETFPVGAVTRLIGLLSEVPDLDSTRACVRLADRILRMIEEEQEKEQEKIRQQQQQQQSQPQESDDSSSQSQAASSNSDQDDDSSDDDSKQDDSSQVDDSQSDQDDGQDQSQTPAQSSDDDGDDNDQQSGQGHTQSAGSSSDQSQDQDSEQLAQALASVLSAGENDVPDDLFEAVQALLGSQPRNAYDADVEMPIAVDPSRNPAVGNAVLNKVLSHSGKIRASLQGLVQSSRYDRPVAKRSGNRIVGGKLSRLVQGDTRVFERRFHHRAPNTAIHLLIDGSGSMSGVHDQQSKSRLIDIAIESSVALALALEGISGVNPAVTRFPSGDTSNVIPLLRHGQKVRPNAAVFLPVTDGCTPLHSALWYAAASVLATREERKIIIVLTDGEPDDRSLTKAIINRCEATGIELVGIGICHNVSHLFDNSICISNVSELKTELFRISRDLLLTA